VSLCGKEVAVKHTQTCGLPLVPAISTSAVFTSVFMILVPCFLRSSAAAGWSGDRLAVVSPLALVVSRRSRGSSGNKTCKLHMKMHYTRSFISYLCYSMAEILHNTIIILLAANIFAGEYKIKI